MDNNHIKVSVLMLTYNHAEYIRQAIESVLSQKTDFCFELVIGDDASTDGTQEILREYKKKNPGIIKLILRKKNIGATRNMVSVKKHCYGDYIAILEGDDYWTDTEKLQKQIDFLDDNSQYIGCYSDCDIIKDSYFPFRYAKKDINTLKDYFLDKGKGLLHIPSATLIFRNIYKNNPELQKYFSKNNILGDRIEHAILLTRGKLKYIPLKTATYRYISKKGNSYSSMDKLKKDKEYRTAMKVCMCISDRKYYKYWYKQIVQCDEAIIRFMYKEGQLYNIRHFYMKEMNIIEKLLYIKNIINR